MNNPEYAPEGIFTTPNENPLTYKDIPGISFHKPDDGIIYYYDQPLMFVAYIEDQLVIATLLKDEHNYPEKPRKGFEQVIAIAITEETLHKIYNSELPLRRMWDEPKNWFIQDDWVHNGGGFRDSTWTHKYKVWKNVPYEEDWKQKDNIYLSIEKTKKAGGI
jgi:hypothetical protein